MTPDNYVVDKRDWSRVDTYIAQQERKLVRVDGGGNEWVAVTPETQEEQKLDDGSMRNLAELVVRIEQHYGFPCDIEWAMEGEGLYVVQSRPITTLA